MLLFNITATLPADEHTAGDQATGRLSMPPAMPHTPMALPPTPTANLPAR